MVNNRKYLKEKLLTILPQPNQFTIELKLQIILKLQKEASYVMLEEDYQDICQYCFDVMEILEKLKAGECFIKGILSYEIAKAKINIGKLNPSKLDKVCINQGERLKFATTVFFIKILNSKKLILKKILKNIFFKKKIQSFHSLVSVIIL